jgi:lipopolysaccharide transport system ATP-binding protein
MKPCIKAENVSKKYLIRHQRRERYFALRDVLAGSVRAMGRRVAVAFSGSAEANNNEEEFWALKNVDFEIRQGERIGLIGPNGAGKSTLLKILSRITEPTTGRIAIHGRVASLLEVGTGFHPELTGRENIYLNGAIHGMSKAEIIRKFDEIVAFSEIEKFLDTPVKRYSSGMYVRLAFSVAAHLDPELLIVDEVLAVGDIHFQKKCLEKMEDVASEGRTLLLVSHNMSSIVSLSTRCILLSAGKIVEEGLPQRVIQTFQNSYLDQTFGQSDLRAVQRYGNKKAQFVSVLMTPYDQSASKLAYPVTGCDLHFELAIQADEEIVSATVALIVYDESGNRLIDANTLIKGTSISLKQDEKTTVRFLLKNVRLKPDAYTIGLWLGVPNDADIDGIRYATSFRMEAAREDILYTTPFPGVYACEFECRLPG